MNFSSKIRSITNKINLIAGTFFLIFAAIIFIAIVLQLLGFGTYASGKNSSINSFGAMLYSVYGFTSILIPAFLIAAAVCCFKKISSKRIAFLLIAMIAPFFTVAITENICRGFFKSPTNNFLAVKLTTTIIISTLLLVTEIIGIYLLSKKIGHNFFSHGVKPKTKETPTDEMPDDGAEDNFGVPKEVFNFANYTVGQDIEPPPQKVEPYSLSEKINEVILNSNEASEKIAEYKEKQQEELSPKKKTGFLHSLANTHAAKNIWTEAIQAIDDSENNTFDNAKTIADAEAELLSEQFVDGAELYDTSEETSVAYADVDAELEFVPADDALADDAEQFADSAELYDTSEETSVACADIDADADADLEFVPATDAEVPIEEPEDSSITETSATPPNEFSSAKNVFAQMEEDIRNSLSAEQESVIEDDATTETYIETADAQSEAPKLSALPPKDSRPKFRGKYKISTDLLIEYEDDKYWVIDKETEQASLQLKDTLNEFNIEADVIGIKKGPVVTMFELLPAPGVKLSKVVALQDNIALRLAASSVRIVAPIPGKRAVGIEIPNKNRSIVSFREIVEMNLPEYKKMAVPVILGKDILGKPQIIDLVKTPHLLIAGATGAGKSVCVNSMILSILYKRSPNEVRMILIDPKIVELKLYNDIPHLLTPVITEPKRAFQSLQYCLCEMERRYALLDTMGVRDISSYNTRIEERNIATEKLPYIIVIIDEFADLMATTGKELETTLARLAAMSRAVGIHLVLATQRPSIDVITGLIKANIPSRIAFMVASKMDSRIIVDQVGAEKLLGRGDMLYASAVDPYPVRIQGTFVTDNEVENVVEAVKQYGEPDYIDDEIFVDDDEDGSGEPSLFGDGEDPLYNQALDIVLQSGKASASYLQRRLKIGYNRAARLVEEMEERGIVGPANGSKPREVIHVP